MIKRFIVTGGYVVPDPPIAPRAYYISSAGSGDGTTSGTPGPISVLTSAVLIDGDSIFFNKGDTIFIDELNIHNIDNITIGAFGTGADPILIGSSYIGGQTFIDNGDGTWYLPLATAPKWICEGDVLLRLAESDWIPITANVSSLVKRVNAATVNAMSSIIGAKCRYKEWPFRSSEEFTVTAYDSGTGNITMAGGIDVQGGGVGQPLKLYNQKQFMTTAGDWFYDSAAERLYIKSTTTPTGRDLRIMTSDTCFHVQNSSGITIQNLDIKHYFKYNILGIDSPTLSVLNCHIHAGRGDAIRATGNPSTNLNIQDSTMDNFGLRGIEIGGIQGATFTNVTIHDIGMQLNLGIPFDANKTGGTAITPMIGTYTIKIPNNIIIDHCTLYNLGYQGVQLFGSNWQVKNSIIHDFMTKWTDGGGVHLYYANVFSASTSSNLIQHCIIYNAAGSVEGIVSPPAITCPGIYFDSGINNNTADSNVIYNTGTYNIYCNFQNTQHIFTNNLIVADNFGVTIQQNTTVNANYPYTVTSNCVLTGNIIALKTSSARAVTVISWNGLTTFNPFSSINNNHYVSPYTANVNRRSSNGSAFTQMDLASWQTYIAGDGSATARTNYKVTPDSDDILLEVNATDNPVNFNTPAGYSDYNAGAFTNPVSIPARYGLIYFQN